MDRNSREILSEADAPPSIALAERDDFVAGPHHAQGVATDAGEQVEHFHPTLTFDGTNGLRTSMHRSQ